MLALQAGRAAYACLLALGLFAVAYAQDYPSRPVKMGVGFGPGGLGDITTRAIAQKLSDSFGKPFVVENMPGAGGITAASSVARAAPDGHTILLVSGQNAASPSLFKSLPYDPVADFATISTIGLFDFIFIVGKDSPYQTLKDAIDAARRDRDKFNIGTISAGSIQNLAALLFASTTDLKVPTVPFRTTGDVIAGLLSGQLQVGYETVPGVINQLKAGTIRALAVTSEKPLPYLPGVPTTAEAGFPHLALSSWNGYVAPARTPRPIVDKLNAELAKALQAPDIRRKLIDFGITPHASTPEAMQRTFEADVVRWRQVIMDNKIAQQ
jgi:tripartite-type tricarboxylate transporter receptor subunit TctC